MSGTWRDCRAFLADLDGHVARRSRDEPVPHVDACTACAARLQAASRQASELRRLPAPVLPERLRSPGFLAAIYERAGSRSEARLGPVLGRTLTGKSAPADADWLAPEDAAEVAQSLLGSLPSGRPPGWLWTRIQTEIRALIQLRRRSRRMRRIRVAGLLAASLLISAVALWAGGRHELTEADVHIYPLSSPLPLDSGLDVVEAIRQGGEER
jgi:hypothetical protein